METRYPWAPILYDWAEDNGYLNEWLRERVLNRRNGIEFSKSDHLRAIVYSLLTNQRPWEGIRLLIPQIDDIFFNFDVEKVREAEPSYFINALTDIRAGNRAIRRQMRDLRQNIEVLDRMEREKGSVDAFITSMVPCEIVRVLSDSRSEYKIKNIGVALAWEYLRCVGIDAVKPDTHTRRFFGNERMGNGTHAYATEDEVFEVINEISSETGFLKIDIDSAVWSYCATGRGEVCTAEPECDRCLIRKYCKFNQQ